MQLTQEISDLLSLTSNGQISPRMKQAVVYIHQCYVRKISLKEVASYAGIHPAYLCRRFKRELGITFHSYILRIRIQTATSLLTHSGKSIKEISYDLGFSRPEVFSKTFKRCMGCTPTLYRSQNAFYSLTTRYMAHIPQSSGHSERHS